MRRISQYFRTTTESAVAEKIGLSELGRVPVKIQEMLPMEQSLDEELEQAAKVSACSFFLYNYIKKTSFFKLKVRSDIKT